MKKNQKLWGVLFCLVEVAIGVLLLIDPIAFTSGIVVVLGALLSAFGIVSVLQYFNTPAAEAAKEQRLTKGLLLLLVGVFAMFGTKKILSVFTMITMLYGVMMAVLGIAKLQLLVDTLRQKGERWAVALVDAVLTLAFAAVVLWNPFKTTEALWRFTGIAVLADAVLDLAAVILVRQAAREAAE